MGGTLIAWVTVVFLPKLKHLNLLLQLAVRHLRIFCKIFANRRFWKNLQRKCPYFRMFFATVIYFWKTTFTVISTHLLKLWYYDLPKKNLLWKVFRKNACVYLKDWSTVMKEYRIMVSTNRGKKIKEKHKSGKFC